MSLEELDSAGVHIAGSFQEWDPAATSMTDIGDGIYSVTLELVSGVHHTYKFINGNTFDGQETVPAACGEDDGFGGLNRYLDVPAIDETLPLVCFSSCEECVTPVDVDVTFQVDMSQQTISPDGVHIAAGFQGWAPGETLMTDAGGGIYTYTAILQSGTYQEYKFVNGDEWGEDEVVPAECSFNNNRFFTTPEVDTTLGTVCYALCGPCPTPVEVEITFQVDMTEQEVSANGIHLIGSFNAFDPTATEMTLLRNGIYAASLTLTEGNQHSYKFVNGNTLAGEETVPEECADTAGYRELTVPGEDLIISEVCFAACGPCIPPPTANVIFNVDMSNEDISNEGIFIVGTFQDWTLAATPMTLTENNIYTYTTALVVGDSIEFKYMNGITWDDAEIISGECINGGGNRYLTIPEEDLTLDLVCFGTCAACIEPLPVDITFQVDMSNEIVSSEGVFVAGSFNDYNASSTQMTAMGGGMYAITLTLIAGDNHQYKYLNGPSYDYQESVPEACGVPDGYGGFNRALLVEETDQVIDPVCFGACDACSRDQAIALYAGWNSLSSYRLPDDTNIEALMSQINDELVIMQTMTEVYFPGGGLNTIVDWESQSAYKIKVTEDVSLNITGIIEQNKTLQLEAGWNLIPVLSDQPVNVEALFADVIADVVVIKEIADVGIFWPFYNINTLGSMQIGKAYFIKMTAPGEITFP